MQLITFNDADHLLSWTAVADALEAGHKLSKAEIGDLLLRKDANSLLSRAAWIDEIGVALKSMSVFPENGALDPPKPSIHGATLLFNRQDGSVDAVIDGILVTKWKTAGDSVLGARLLASENPKTLLVVGAGTVARTLFPAYREIFPSITSFRIFNRNPESADRLISEFTPDGFEIERVEDLGLAAVEADIIACATMSNEPVLRGEWVQPGTHVDLIGAFRPDMREADDDLILNSELFVDSRSTTLGHIGEVQTPIDQGIITENHIRGDLYDLCNGTMGRSGPDAITVFKNGGGAHLDLMVSALIKQVFENNQAA
ncbi:MAG: ornithine cyclodeaminase [Pseudomonadota bacterium]